MDRNQKLFLIIVSLFALGDFTSVSITNLYLWQLTNSFQKILLFDVFVFAGMAVSGLLASVLGAKIGNKLVFFLSMIFYICQFVLLIWQGSHIVTLLQILGTISGFAIGCLSYSYTVLIQEITVTGGREKFFGTRTSLVNTITLVGVPMLTFVASHFHSYNPVFLLALLLMCVVAILVLGLNVIEQTSSFHLFNTEHVLLKFPNVRSYIIAKYLYGIQNGLFWVVLGIVTLQFVGDVFRWGIFSSFLTLISITAAFIYGRKVNLQSGKYGAVLATFIFAGTTLFLAINWNFVTFVIYQMVLVVLNVIMAVSFDSFMASVIEENQETTNLRNELNGVGEFVLDLGRFTPILILLLLQISFNNNLYLRIAFLIVAPLPLLIMNTLKKTQAFN